MKRSREIERGGEYYGESHEDRLNELKYRMMKLNNVEPGQIQLGLPYDESASSENDEHQDFGSDAGTDSMSYEESDEEIDAPQEEGGYQDDEEDEDEEEGEHVNNQFEGNENGVHGIEVHGLLAGGATSQKLAEALAHIEEVTKENKELRVVVDKLVQSQTSMVAQNDRMEQQYNELKTMFLSYMGSSSVEKIPEKDPACEENSKDLGGRNDRENASSLSSMNKRKENVSQVALESVKKVQNVNAYIEKMKNANKINAEQESDVRKPMKAVEHDKPRKFQSLDKDGFEGIMKRGMEVGLTSPNSAKIVALGTIQGTDPNTKAMDGHPLADSVEVVVDYVFNQKTVLPRAQGKLKMLGHAQARCIPWPRLNVVRKDGTPLHSKVILNANGTSMQSKMLLSNRGKFNNKENVDPKSTSQATSANSTIKKLQNSSSAKAIGTSGHPLSQTEIPHPGKDRPPRKLGPGCSESPYAKVYDNNVYMTTSRLQQTKAKRGLGSQVNQESQSKVT